MQRILNIANHLQQHAPRDGGTDGSTTVHENLVSSSSTGLPSGYPPFRTELNPVSFLKRTAMLYPTRDAVIYNGITQNYATFSSRVRRFASALLKTKSISKGDRVAVLVPNSPVILEAHFAVPLAGCVLVCINSRLNQNEVEYILQKSKTKVLFVDYELEGLAVNAASCGVDAVIVCRDSYTPSDPYEMFLHEENSAEPPKFDEFPPLLSEDECISINFTSGTTGRPKGVMSHYRGAYLLSLGDVMEMELNCDSKYLWIVPMFHANGWCFPWAVTAVGACHVIIRKVEYDVIWDMLTRVKCTHYGAAPTVQLQIVSHPHARKLDRVVKTMVAAAPPSPTLLESMSKLESLSYSYLWTHRFQGQGQGFIVSDEIRVVNPDMTDTPWDGTTMGEVVMRGNIVMMGYLDDKKATDEAFRGGWFHSGDIGVKHADGYVELRDRKKDIIISAVVSFSDVLEGCVVASPDEKWGERPVAYITLKPGVYGGTPEWMDRLNSHLRTRIAGYKMPARIEIVEELPKTSTGKVQKFILRELEWKRAGKLGGNRIN
ncbi:hypothetical protein BC829DRAFT_388111 [Chytridium lagenaria]|nr:hypothetical protein BC829DRAFT_388111 [Chytridium lagenaria]